MPPASTILVGPNLRGDDGRVTCVPQILEDAASRWPHRVIAHVVGPGRETRSSYARLLERANRFSGGLNAQGVAAGDHVLLRLTDASQFAEALWGCLLAGVVPVVVRGADDHDGDVLAMQTWNDLGRPPIVTSSQQLDEVECWAGTTSRVFACEWLGHTNAVAGRSPLAPDSTAILHVTRARPGRAATVSLSQADLLLAARATPGGSLRGAGSFSVRWPLTNSGPSSGTFARLTGGMRRRGRTPERRTLIRRRGSTVCSSIAPKRRESPAWRSPWLFGRSSVRRWVVGICRR